MRWVKNKRIFPVAGDLRLKKYFALFPTELDNRQVVWLESYYSVEVCQGLYFDKLIETTHLRWQNKFNFSNADIKELKENPAKFLTDPDLETRDTATFVIKQLNLSKPTGEERRGMES